MDGYIEQIIFQFAMCGLCFFIHVVEYIIVVAKIVTLCNQNWMTFFAFHLQIL
jgi:hypothetical protein